MNRQIKTRENEEGTVTLEVLKDVVNVKTEEKYSVGDVITTTRAAAKEILKKRPGVFRIKLA